MSIPETIARWRTTRWFAPVLVFSVLMVLLLLAALLVPRLIDLESSRGVIVAQIERQLGRRVTLGRLSFRLLPRVEVRAERVTIADDPDFAAGDFVTAGSVRLEVGLWSLLRGQPELRGLELDAPTIVLIRTTRDAAPHWNWESLKPLREAQSSVESPPLDLRVRNGSFTLVDRQVTPPVESSYRGIDIRLDGFSPRREFEVALVVTMPDAGGQPGGRLELDGRLGPLVATDLAQTPLDGRLKMERVGIAALEALGGGPPSGRTGELTLDVALAGRLAETLRAKGTLRADNLRLVTTEGVAPARNPLELKFDLAASAPVEKTGRRIDLRLEEAEVALGSTSIELRGQAGIPATTPPEFDLTLAGQGISLASLLESADAFGFGPPAGTKAAGNAELALRVYRQGVEATNPAIEGRAVVRNLRFESATLPQAIEVTELKLDATPEQLTLAPFRTVLGTRTAVEVSRLAITGYRLEPTLSFEGSTSQAQLDDLLKIAESFGVRPGLTASGLVTLRLAAEAKLPTTGPTLTRLAGGGKLAGATIKPSQLNRPFQVANTDLTFSGDSARLDNIALTLGSSTINGWLQVRNFNQPLLGFDLRANQLAVPELEAMIVDAPASGGAPATSLTANGQVAIGRLILDGLTADNVQATVALRQRTLTLDPLTLALYGGGYRGAVKIDQRNGLSDLAFKGRLTGVDVNQLLSASGKKSLLYGRLDGAIDLRGRQSGATSLADNLLGSGQIQISDGKITSFDLMKQVETVGRLFNLPTGGAGTAFRLLKTNLKFEPGQVQTDALQVLMDDLTATGGGLIRLGEPGALQYTILARLSPALTRRILAGKSPAPDAANAGAGSSRTGGLLGSFFVEKDSLVIPLKINGPLTGPSFGLDTATLQQRATGSIMENLQKRIFGEKEPAGTEEAEPKKRPSAPEAIRGILDRLRKKPEKPLEKQP